MDYTWVNDMCNIQHYYRLADCSSEMKEIAAHEINKFAKKYRLESQDAEYIARCTDYTVCRFIDKQVKLQYAELLPKEGTIIKKIKGKLTFTATELDVTDPCYEKDTWCRITVPIEPGIYNYEVRISWEGDWGKRVKAIRIYKENSTGIKLGKFINAHKEDNPHSEVGVDSGFAGFFENKPDYAKDGDNNDWKNLWDWECKNNLNDDYPRIIKGHKNTPVKCEAIYSTSGFGDGSYFVRELINTNKEVCGYELKFI